MSNLLKFIFSSGGLVAFLAIAYKVWMDRHTELRIIRAVYGKNQLTMKVTRNLNSKIRNGKLKIEVNNEIAGDPARNEQKILRLKYWHNGKRYNREYIETEIIDLP